MTQETHHSQPPEGLCKLDIYIFNMQVFFFYSHHHIIMVMLALSLIVGEGDTEYSRCGDFVLQAMHMQ